MEKQMDTITIYHSIKLANAMKIQMDICNFALSFLIPLQKSPSLHRQTFALSLPNSGNSISFSLHPGSPAGIQAL